MDPDDKPQALDYRNTWEAGGARISLHRAESGGWTARVHRDEWGVILLVVDGVFATREEAVAWCERMAATFTRDIADERLDEGEA